MVHEGFALFSTDWIRTEIGYISERKRRHDAIVGQEVPEVLPPRSVPLLNVAQNQVMLVDLELLQLADSEFLGSLVDN